ncbi:MAG: sugar ABC transporter permease, partial [Clostridiales bacterium]|nr:sugar ABC transporter permease [Clostridiales bacterium]
FNSIILKLGGEIIAWKTGYVTGMIMMVTLAAWRELGINMVYCLSALQSIPEELYEAADIDGANAFQKFLFVTIPQVRPIIIYILTLTILNGYRMFTEGYVYWNETNPGDIGLTIVRYIYQQAFQRNDFGMGSAIGVVLLVIVLTVNMFQLNFFGLFKKEDA